MAKSTSTRHQSKSGSKPKRRGKNRQIVLPGQYFFASPRMMHRRYLLKPCYETMEAMKYFIGHYGKKWGIETFAVCVMSNHYHLVGRDTKGKRPKFFQDLNRSMAKFLGTKYGWKGPIFKKMDPPVVLHSAQAVADKIGYTLANPIAAGAVRFSREWPGVITRPEDMGRKTYRAKRPEHYFGKQKTLPDTASWTLKMPDWLLETNRTEADARAEIQAAVERHEKEARAEIAAKGWKYLGAERAKKLDPSSRQRPTKFSVA